MNFEQIYYKYASEGLEFKDILEVWKEERLSPEKIKQQLSSDTGIKVSSADAKQLYKIARSDDFPMPKTAEINVSWELGEREAEDGTKQIFIIRKEKNPTKTASIKQADTEVLYDHISAVPNQLQLYPVTCPAQKNGVEDFLRNKENKPVCIYNSEYCKYFREAMLSETKNQKDIICQISAQEK